MSAAVFYFRKLCFFPAVYRLSYTKHVTEMLHRFVFFLSFY